MMPDDAASIDRLKKRFESFVIMLACFHGFPPRLLKWDNENTKSNSSTGIL